MDETDNTDMRFPASELRASGGEIYCMVFENKNTGLARNLFWSLTLNFEPVGQESYVSMTCDWIPWKLRRWKELDGVKLASQYGEDGIEGSFYVCEHDLMENVSLSLQYVRENLFRLEMEMTVDYQGSEFSDPEPHLLVKGCAIVPFVGLYLGQGIDLTDAAEFLNLSAFESEPSNNEYGKPYYKAKNETRH